MFKRRFGFFDLCIDVTEENVLRIDDILSKLYELGYRTIALNQTVDEKLFIKKKKKGTDKNNTSSILPKLLDVNSLSKRFGKNDKLYILNRITFIGSDPDKLHILSQCPNFKEYDLYAIVPTSQAMLQFICSQANVDLITFKSSAVASKLTRKLYLQAIERNVYFEIQYVDLLEVETRKLIIYCAHLFYMYGRSANMIVSSGARESRTAKNPYDIINIMSFLGLEGERARAVILCEPYSALLRAERRRCGKGIFSIEFTE